jgi:hypothetical protein
MGTAILFYLALKTGHGLAIVPAPYSTERACVAEAERISKPSAKGGIPDAYAYCIRVETPQTR